jgi:ADP-heptose:LPS heptosyltransferase
MKNLLVIKHGAFGDFIMALGPLFYLRKAFPQARITLLTTPPYVGMAQDLGLFQEILLDERSHRLRDIGRLLRDLRSRQFDAIIDFQHSKRVFWYRPFLTWGQPCVWSSAPSRRQFPLDPLPFHFARQLTALVGHEVDVKDITLGLEHAHQLAAQSTLTPQKGGMLLIPGASIGHPEKRWPWQSYRFLAESWTAQGRPLYVVGGEAEKDLAHRLVQGLSHAQDWTGKTAWYDILAMALSSRVILGNDTGPTHVAALAQKPTAIFWRSARQARISGPLGSWAQAFCADPLEGVSPQDVWRWIERIQA